MPISVSPAAGMSFLTGVYGVHWPNAFENVNGTSTYEMLRLFDQIDRKDLGALVAHADEMKYRVNLGRITFAERVVSTRGVPRPVPGDLAGEVSVANQFLAHRSPLLIPADPTRSLPRPIAGQPALSESDYDDAATDLGVEKAAIKAVVDVESGGAFAADGRPIIRYELHRFRDATRGAFDRTHPHLSQHYKPGRAYHAHGQPNEWSMLFGAFLLRGQRETAIRSTSWGMFQIMGDHHRDAGFATPHEFANAMFASSANHLSAFIAVCRAKGCDRHLRAKNWAAFASSYNGTSYRDNNYDVMLAQAYSRHAHVR